MKELPDKSIDCVICDLPYGQIECEWDITIDLKKFWYEVERIIKNDNTPIIHFCNTRFGIDIINSKKDWFRYDLVWNKNRGVNFLNANKQPMRYHEMIYIFSKKASYYKRIDEIGNFTPCKSNKESKKKSISNVYNKVCMINDNDGTHRCIKSVIDCKRPSKRGAHPTEKPEELYEWLLSRYCPEGGTILDPTAGSFNSVAVANRLGLNAIGIEKDEGFYNKALERFAHLTQ